MWDYYKVFRSQHLECEKDLLKIAHYFTLWVGKFRPPHESQVSGIDPLALLPLKLQKWLPTQTQLDSHLCMYFTRGIVIFFHRLHEWLQNTKVTKHRPTYPISQGASSFSFVQVSTNTRVTQHTHLRTHFTRGVLIPFCHRFKKWP